MKTNVLLTSLKSSALLAVIVFVTINARSQAPIYKFRNPSLISGVGGQVNAVYRFPNVNSSGTIDALVKIQNKVGNITLQNIDRTADGYDEAFQPEYKIGASNNAYFEFLITFVLAGTNTASSQPLVDVSGLDIDGSTNGGLTLKEFNRVDMGSGGWCTFNTLNSQLSLSQIGSAFEGDNITGILFGALVDTAAKEVMFSVTNTNVTSITYRAGANSLLPGQSTRYASLYFKKFNYPQGSILSVSNLAAFSGTATDSKANLAWTLTPGNTANNIVLEKSNTGKDFQTVAEFWVNVDGSSERNFKYTDNRSASAQTYYRLKITGSDGRIQYSNILHFQSKEADMNSLSVYPSLIQSATTVNYQSSQKQSAVIFVADMSGRIVKQQDAMLEQGTNSIRISGFDQLQKGNYIISVHTMQDKLAKQIIVQ